jgi:hypothetical protein
MTTILCTLNTMILQYKKMKKKKLKNEHQMSPLLILVGPLLMHRWTAKVKRRGISWSAC